MAKFIFPLSELEKQFEINCSTRKAVKQFENAGGIWGHQPFLEFMEQFDDSYCYSIAENKTNKMFGGKIFTFVVTIYQFDE